jgi:hypothetical protein
MTRRALDHQRAALPEVQRARRSWIHHQTRKAARLLDDLATIDHRDGTPEAAQRTAELLLAAAGELGAAVRELTAADLADS